MFDFFFAIFGGIYCAGKSAFNKSKDRDVQNRKRKYEITDSVLRKYREYPKTLDDGWALLDEIQEELKDLFGEEWVEIYKTTTGDFVGLHPHPCDNPKRRFPHYRCEWGIWAIAYNLWLSKHGYVSDVEYEINNPHDFGKLSNYVWIEKFPVLQDEQKLLVKMFQIIENNLQKQHPELNLGLWLHHYEGNSNSPWTIKWSYYFDSVGYTPLKKPW